MAELSQNVVQGVVPAVGVPDKGFYVDQFALVQLFVLVAHGRGSLMMV